MNNYITHAPETIIFVVILFLLGLILNKNIIYLSIFLLVSFLFFYRGFNNNIQVSDNIVYIPCQGKILNIEENDNNYHISIFLNLHNIHIQYMPMSGKIIQIIHKKGKFHPAYFFEKSKYNERTLTKIKTDYGIINFYQIAGQIARRIKVFHKENTILKSLEPFGLIKFGSRCDLLVPKENFILNEKLREGVNVNIGDIFGYYKKNYHN
jgi:phosphatidylserine decarboxylase